MDGVTVVWLREDVDFPVLVATRVRPVEAGVEVETEERRLLLTPSTDLDDDDELRPLFIEDERPVEVAEDERPLLDETRRLLLLYEAELLPPAYVRPEELRE